VAGSWSAACRKSPHDPSVEYAGDSILFDQHGQQPVLQDVKQSSNGSSQIALGENMETRSLLRNSLVSLAAAAMFAFVSTAAMAQTADSEEISRLLTQAKSHAVLVADDASQLQSFVNSTDSWVSHSAKLSQMVEHVNALGVVNKGLADLRPQGSPWQQIAIDRVDPLLRDVAAQLTATIKHLKTHQSQIHMGPYRDLVQATHDYASRTAEMISDFVEYDRAKSRVEALERKLELPTTVSGE